MADVAGGRQPGDGGAGESGPVDPEVFDVSGTLRRLDDDDELLRELVSIFLDDQAERHAELAGAVAAGDLPRVTRLAHAVKGATASLGANAAASAAAALEGTARSGDDSETRLAFSTLEREHGRLLEALRSFGAS